MFGLSLYNPHIFTVGFLVVWPIFIQSSHLYCRLPRCLAYLYTILHLYCGLPRCLAYLYTILPSLLSSSSLFGLSLYNPPIFAVVFLVVWPIFIQSSHLYCRLPRCLAYLYIILTSLLSSSSLFGLSLYNPPIFAVVFLVVWPIFIQSSHLCRRLPRCMAYLYIILPSLPSSSSLFGLSLYNPPIFAVVFLVVWPIFIQSSHLCRRLPRCLAYLYTILPSLPSSSSLYGLSLYNPPIFTVVFLVVWPIFIQSSHLCRRLPRCLAHLYTILPSLLSSPSLSGLSLYNPPIFAVVFLVVWPIFIQSSHLCCRLPRCLAYLYTILPSLPSSSSLFGLSLYNPPIFAVVSLVVWPIFIQSSHLCRRLPRCLAYLYTILPSLLSSPSVSATSLPVCRKLRILLTRQLLSAISRRSF